MSVVKLHARIFLGPVMPGMDVIPDALPRERVPITIAIVFLFLVGLVPGKWVETVSLIAIEQPAIQHVVSSANVNLEFH
jgi:NADH:ubiquinone oxidoreductase subunit 4 (subunit M)